MDTVGATAPLTTILWDRLAASIHFNAQHDSLVDLSAVVNP